MKTIILWTLLGAVLGATFGGIVGAFGPVVFSPDTPQPVFAWSVTGLVGFVTGILLGLGAGIFFHRGKE